MTSNMILMLILIALSYWRDKEALRGGGALNRWVSYALMAVSMGILAYTTTARTLFYPMEWLGRILKPLLPFS